MSKFMCAVKRRCRTVLALVLPYVAGGFVVFSHANEDPIAGALRGDQYAPDVSISASGGYVVWHDNVSDGKGQGFGVYARKLNTSLEGVSNVFRVNLGRPQDQENPRVAMLPGGGAVFVWQGGRLGKQNIFARFRSAKNTWMSEGCMANSLRELPRQDPAVTALPAGAVAVWTSLGQDGSFGGIYGQRFSLNGGKQGTEFRANVWTNGNQRTPAVAAVGGGSFVVVWATEQQRFPGSVDIVGRVFDGMGRPQGGEFWINTSSNICLNPSLIGLPSGGFAVTWTERSLRDRTNSLDVYVRVLDAAGRSEAKTATLVNTFRLGDQFGSKIAFAGDRFLVVWTSLKQDGSREGVFGQYLAPDLNPIGSEMRINTTTVSQQMQPCVAGNLGGQLLVVWSSFVANTSFDLFANRMR